MAPPLAGGEGGEGERGMSPSPQPSPIKGEGKICEMEKAKILIAEDEKTQRDLLEGFLKKEGFSVEAVANGREALQKLQGNFFHIALIDYKMPEFDGLQTLPEVRKRYPAFSQC